MVLLWKGATVVLSIPAYLLPPPGDVAITFVARGGYLAEHALVTLSEMLLGLLVGGAAGILAALVMALSGLARRFLLPVVVTSQTLPVFAIAPLVVIWFGYGMGSKVVMASLIIFFPVAASFLDGLNATREEWLDLARGWGAGKFALLFKVRVPAALPHLATGVKMAATVAPIGAIVGEWAGASAGLGYVMLQANARMQTDLVFACLVILAVLALGLRSAVAALMDQLIFWQTQSR